MSSPLFQVSCVVVFILRWNLLLISFEVALPTRGAKREGERESVVRRQIMMDGFAVSCLCFIPISFSFCSALKHTILFYMIY